MNKINVLILLCLVGCGKTAYTEDREPAPAKTVTAVVTEKTKECTRSYTQGETPPEWTCKEETKKDNKVIVVTDDDDDVPQQQAPRKKTK